tara:strand:+ start:286 stop:1437 length:1152 start_codon:yes stop_codon:yes gene_type:complete
MNHKNKTKKRNNKLGKKTRKGGKVIGSGGFGCVFRPALKCSKKRNRGANMVSKLMTKRHAKKEYSTIKKIKKKLSVIPQYSNHFLINNVSSCSPAPLTESDLSNFDEKCKVMKKYDDITKQNVNENLKKLKSLNLPDGGVSLSTYYGNMKTESDFDYINKQLIELLKNGILPMNELGVYHGDVKEGNILFNLHTHRIGLIDWGLSFSTNSKNAKIPKLLKNKPLQYNLPFSIILFNSTFDKLYKEFLKTHTSNQKSSLRIFITDYIDTWIDKRGEGHLEVIEDVWSKVSNQKNIDVIQTYIVPYLTDILIEFTYNGKFNKRYYFNTIFLPNLDIWGFLMSYSSVLEHDTFQKGKFISKLYMDYLISTPIERINPSEVISSLNM